MVSAGATKLYVILGKDKELIMRFLGNGQDEGVNIAYLFQKVPNGLAKALLEVKPFVTSEDLLLFGMPDTVIGGTFSYKTLLNTMIRESASIGLALVRVKDPEHFGVVELDRRNNKILSIEDKPPRPLSNWIWAAASFDPRFFGAMEKVRADHGEYQLTDAFRIAIDTGLRVTAVRFPSAVYTDVGVKRLIV